MSMGEPKCGSCGSDLMVGMFHQCKPVWDEENNKLSAEVESLRSKLESSQAEVDRLKVAVETHKQDRALDREQLRRANGELSMANASIAHRDIEIQCKREQEAAVREELRVALLQHNETKYAMSDAVTHLNLQVDAYEKALKAIYNHESSQPGILRAIALNALNNPDTKR